MPKLNRVLLANAASCIAFGALFAAAPQAVGDFLGAESGTAPQVICVLGVMLAVNGAHLVWAARRAFPGKILIAYFSAGDFVWTVGTVTLVFYGGWITTPGGVAATLMVAAIVGLLGIAQIAGYSREATRLRSNV